MLQHLSNNLIIFILIGKDKSYMQIVNTVQILKTWFRTKMLFPTLKKDTLNFYLAL